jgi:DNA-binding beta-propeller fold protein YncE
MLLILGCKDDEPQKFQTQEFDNDGRRVWVLNEGNFRSANASISLHYPDINVDWHDYFSGANQGLPLGDVAQSMSKINEEYWVVVNNSGKIEVMEQNGLSIDQIVGFNSPRYCLQGPNNKVYVSDLYQDAIYVVDALQKSIIKQIPAKGWTEEMEIIGDRLFVCQVDSSQLLVINTLNDSLESSISTAKSPLSLAVDQHNKIWVACSGGIDQDQPALMRIDPNTLNIELDLRIADVSKSINELAISPDGGTLYYLMEDVFKMGVVSNSLPASPWHSRPFTNYYAMAVDPNNGEVYLSDAIDYQQDGVIYRLDENANPLHQFKAGLIPGFFYFEEP